MGDVVDCAFVWQPLSEAAVAERLMGVAASAAEEDADLAD